MRRRIGTTNEDSSPFQQYTRHAPSCNDHPLQPDDVQFTLVTQLSNDRLWMLRHHCQRWPYTMSIAILTNQTQSQVLDGLLNLGCDSSQVTVQVLSTTDYADTDYPVNVLRNLALSHVTTSHVLYVDIDFWVSTDVHYLLNADSTRQAFASNPKLAVVIPAFQLHRVCREWRECPELNIPRMPHTMDDLLTLLRNQLGSIFDPTNRGGHGSTLYAPWIRQNPGSLLEIPCIRSNRYEPYLAFRYCYETPPFQPAFSGYGKNKMTMVMHMRWAGYKFSQLGGAYLVHYPHLDSKSRMEWNVSPKQHARMNEDQSSEDWAAYKRGRVDATFVDFRTWLQRDVPDETKVPKCHNAEDDDARLWIHRSSRGRNGNNQT
jgi:Glycosyl-transferase for dystroglycan